MGLCRIFLCCFFNMEVSGKGKITKNAPVFTQFIYQGEDAIYQNNPLKPGEFYNPILQGCYPDPSITRKGNDYYLVCSSFAMFPGVPIFHSNDLVNWKQIGHVLDRTSQLKVEDCGISAGVYAPAIRYNPNNDTFLYDNHSIFRWLWKYGGKRQRIRRMAGVIRSKLQILKALILLFFF